MMKTLAEELGLDATAQRAQRVELLNVNGKAFAKAVVSSVEFRQYVVNGLLTKSLPHQVLTKLMDYAWGKVPDRVEVDNVTNKYDHLTKEQLQARALYLAEMAAQLEEPVEQDALPDDDPSPSSIH